MTVPALRTVRDHDTYLASIGFEARWTPAWLTYHIVRRDTGACVAVAQSLPAAIDYLHRARQLDGDFPTARLPGIPCPICTNPEGTE